MTLASDYPFVPVSEFTQGNNWYVLTIRNLYISYNSTSHKLERSATAPTTYSDNYLFQFKGNPFDGYKILNRQAGTGKAAGSASVANQVVLEMMTEAQARNYVLTNASGFHFRESTNPNGYLNDNQGVSYWMNGAAANDAGGAFTFAKIDLNDHLIAYKNKKTELNRLLSNTAALAIFNAATVTAVKNEMNTYAPANTEAGNTAALAKVEGWYNTLYATIDTQVTLQTPVRSGKYVTVDLAGQVVHKPTKGAESAFLVKGSANGLTFTHAASTRKVGKTGSNGGHVLLADLDAAEQGVFKLKVFEGNNDQVAFICTQPGHNNFNAVHADQNGNVVAWSAGEVGGSTWKVEKSTYSDTDILTAARKRLTDAEETIPLGQGLGEYSVTTPTDYQAAQTSTDIATVEKGVEAVLRATLNLPKAGQFLRIKTTKGGEKYVSATNVENRLGIVASADFTTLFYFDGMNLVGVGDGRFVALKSNFPVTAEYNSAGQPIEFHESENADEIGIYRINVGQRALFANATQTKVDAGGKNTDTEAGYRFKLEEVTELPIEVGETGYATFFTPAAATLSGGTAYKAKVKGGNLSLTSIDGTIPANTAFVLRATANTTVNLQLGATAAAALTDNDLTGAVTTAAAPISATDNVYALVKNASGEAVFGKLAAGLRKRAFRAFVTTASGSAQALDFSFGHVTGIETFDIEAAHAPIYDLSGRRVLTPAQGGVYLQNGKKFIQK